MNRELLSSILALLLAVTTLACARRSDQQGDQLIVYAAASLRDALFDLAVEFHRSSGIRPVFNLAGSNVLALQIDAAPAADVFLSADEKWMDFLAERGRIDPATRLTFLSNRLVVIVNRHHPAVQLDPLRLADGDFRFLSLADPEAVPAGRYARQYLRSVKTNGIDLWELLQDRVVPAPDVRAALGLVEAEPDIVGIVYLTDALESDRVRVVFEVPAESGPPIRYSAAAVLDAPNAHNTGRFLAFLQSPEAKAIFTGHGFSIDPERQ